MNDFPALKDPVGILPVDIGFGHILAAGHLDNGPERLLHIPRLPQLVLAPLEVEPQHRNSPPIDFVWVNLAVRIWVCDHLAAPRKTDRRSVRLPRSRFQIRSVTFFVSS